MKNKLSFKNYLKGFGFIVLFLLLVAAGIYAVFDLMENEPLIMSTPFIEQDAGFYKLDTNTNWMKLNNPADSIVKE